MDLERRVQILEQEVQILKNQVQTTLLEIQEQLLSNTYPSLRTENTPQPTMRSTPDEPLTGIQKVVLEETPVSNPDRPAKISQKQSHSPAETPQRNPERQDAQRPVPQQKSQKSASHSKVTAPESTDEQPQQFRNVVLKLIAGVQNIGIDKSRKQPHG